MSTQARKTSQKKENIAFKGYEVTFEPLSDPERKKLPKKLLAQLADIPAGIKSDPEGMLFRVSGLAKDYPKFLPFKNWLLQIYEEEHKSEDLQ